MKVAYYMQAMHSHHCMGLELRGSVCVSTGHDCSSAKSTVSEHLITDLYKGHTVCRHTHAQRIYVSNQGAQISFEGMVTLHHGPGINTQNAQIKDTFVIANTPLMRHL